MSAWRYLLGCAVTSLSLVPGSLAHGQNRPSQPDPGNRLNNPFRTQFTPAWTATLQDPVKLIELGPVTDAKRTNLVLLIGGRTASDTQRKLRVLHWTGSQFNLDTEVVSQSVGIDTLLLGRFHPGSPTPLVVPSAPAAQGKRPAKPKPAAQSHTLQVLTNTGIYAWFDNSLQPLFARQLPDVKQAIIQDNHPDLVVVGAGDGASPFEFTQSEMRQAAKEKLQGGGYAHFGIGMQTYPGSDTLSLAPGVRFVQAVWVGRTKWLIGLARGKVVGSLDDPTATTGDRLVIYTPKFPSRDKNFWESRMDDLEESWRSDPLPGRVLDVRVGDPHNEGKPGVLVLTSENDNRDRRITFFGVSGSG